MSFMRRTYVLAGAGALAIAAMTMLPIQQSAAQQSPRAEKKPNVLFILVDDLRPDLGTYGHPTAKTPHMDSLGKSGIVFERAYTQQAVCGPSRAALMTGLRPDTTKITDLDSPVDKNAPTATTVLDLFKQAGYNTYGYGKIYHHIDDDKDGWTFRDGDAEKDMRQADRKAKLPRVGVGRVPDGQPLPDGVNVDQALKEMPKLARSGKPFFLAVGIHRPHLPFIAPESSWKRYTPATVPGPINPQGQKGAPPWALVSYEVWNYPDTKQYQPNMPKAKADEFRWGYLAAVSYADDQVGRILAALKEQGLEDDTIVVLWGDHGFKLGDHNAWAKHSTADIDIHIPMMIRAPGVTRPGTRTKALVETVDIYPTLAELAGLVAPSNLEGLSTRPLMSDPTRLWKQAAFAQYQRNGNTSGQGPLDGRTVRTDKFRYTAWVSRKTGQVVARELYDTSSDPNESVNVAEDRKYADAVRDLETVRVGGWKAVRDAVKR